VYHIVEARIRAALAEVLKQRGVEDVSVVTQRPPDIAMGESATPVAFELAKRLRRAPRQIAQEMAQELALAAIPGVARVETAGAGYINFFFDRSAFFAAATEQFRPDAGALPGPAVTLGAKCIVEHTNINPNKAAHIGHLRNAALGDTFVRLLRREGRPVEVQNYIDNTGVQVADVVVGFQHIEKKSVEEVRELAAAPRFDYLCWDLYAQVTNFLGEDAARLELRSRTLRAIEEGQGAEAEIAEIVSVAISHCHLRTMARLGVEYDLLPRESEILQLKFWDAAFAQLKERGAIHKAVAGKNAGCWVMKLDVSEGGTDSGAGGASGGEADDDAKVIVRSNGTVTYVGKDIAYQMWKFGLLGRDFAYRRFHTYQDGHNVWTTSVSGGEADAPPFGKAADVFNVIDARQAYLQNVVVAGLRALGFAKQAEHSVHFSYEIVALTPRCAAEMGYTLTEEEAAKPYVEVSGRKGMGVKADDLLDRMEVAARAEVDPRHAGAPEPERESIAHAIAIGALRYFLLKYTRTAIIAFDFKDALSFEGETGPYCQYAVVRARNIFRKAAEQDPNFRVEELFGSPQRGEAAAKYSTSPAAFLEGPGGNELWELALLAGSLDWQVAAAVSAQEPAFVAKYAFELAQGFSVFYHHHHVLSEAVPERKTFLLQLSRFVELQLVAALDLLGIDAPQKM
jgi:arginyl-tRNA synthetase